MNEPLALWAYTLDLRYGVWDQHWRWQAWHPTYGARTWWQATETRAPGPLDQPRIAGDLWQGALMLLEANTAKL